LLNASHIVPWAIDVKNRTNPKNGLCLNAVHDRAFDCGLLTITSDFRVQLSPKARGVGADKASEEFLWRFQGLTISTPRHFGPDVNFLEYHNENVFIKR
jgi:predicted restriction endonuclease